MINKIKQIIHLFNEASCIDNQADRNDYIQSIPLNMTEDWIKKLLVNSWPVSDMDFGVNNIYGLECISKSPLQTDLIKIGYLHIGCGANGDPIVLRLNDSYVCFQDHDSERLNDDLKRSIYPYKHLSDYLIDCMDLESDLPADASDIKAKKL